MVTGCLVQLVTCLAADTCLTAGPGVATSIPARSHTFVEIDHEIISTAILLPSAHLRRVVVSYTQKYVHVVLVNCLVKLDKEKSVVRLIDRPYMTIDVDWEVKDQTKQTNKILMLLAYAQMPLIHTHADVSSKDRCLIIDMSLNLHPHCMYTRNKFLASLHI